MEAVYFHQGYMVSLQNARKNAVNIYIPPLAIRVHPNTLGENPANSTGNPGEILPIPAPAVPMSWLADL
jgi:hypothetical protein